MGADHLPPQFGVWFSMYVLRKTLLTYNFIFQVNHYSKDQTISLIFLTLKQDIIHQCIYIQLISLIHFHRTHIQRHGAVCAYKHGMCSQTAHKHGAAFQKAASFSQTCFISLIPSMTMLQSQPSSSSLQIKTLFAHICLSKLQSTSLMHVSEEKNSYINNKN